MVSNRNACVSAFLNPQCFGLQHFLAALGTEASVKDSENRKSPTLKQEPQQSLRPQRERKKKKKVI